MGDFEDYGDYYGEGEGGDNGADGSMMEGGEEGAGGKDPTGLAWEDMTVAADGYCKCLVCGSSYSSRTNAFRHYKEKHLHSGVKYPCLQCNKIFELERKMNDHLLNIHGISVKDLKRKHQGL